MGALRVIVADDHALVREGIAGLIAAEPDLEVVATADDLPSLLEVAGAIRPDVVVTDIRMPPTHTDEGIRAAAELCADQPGIGVVVLSMFASPAYARTLLGDGTAGRAYLLKPRVQTTDELTAAVRAVASGRSVVDPAVIETLLGARPGSGCGPHRTLDRLTAREQDVLALMATGASNASIASTLVIGAKTVETHVRAIFMKLDLADESTLSRRVAAVLRFLDDLHTP